LQDVSDKGFVAIIYKEHSKLILPHQKRRKPT
jgi:hypothetical protein